MRHLFRIIAVVGVSAILSVFQISFAQSFFNTLYTIIGIFFSIGYSIVIGFDFSEMTNEKLVTSLRRNLKTIERSFIVYFGISTIAFFISDQRPCPITIKGYQFSFLALSASVSVYIIIYLVVNFSRLQKLKNEISDLMRKDKSSSD